MSQIKLETTEDSIDETCRTMQNLIRQVDWHIENLSSLSSHSRSFNDSSASTSRDSMNANNAVPASESDTRLSHDALSYSSEHTVTSDSSGSDTIILYNNDETLPPEPSNPSGQDVIVIGTPTTEPRSRRRARRDASVLNANVPVIDLSNYPEMRASSPILISSDEENDVPAAVTTTEQQVAVTTWSEITFNNFVVSVQTPNPPRISVLLSNRRRNNQTRRSDRILDDIDRSNDVNDISAVGPTPAPIVPASPIAQPSSQGANNNSGTQAAAAGTPKATIICPICYETLANQQAVSTSCGHVFCSNCIWRALRDAKKCPICNKKLTKASQMHPVYFATE